MFDQMQVNAKGRVKLELYNEHGTFFVKEKKNLVVNSANEIIGKVMSDPAKTVRAHQTDRGDTTVAANANGHYVFALSKQREMDGVYEVDKGSSNTSLELIIPDIKQITELKKVTVNGVDLIIDQDVFVKDADAGKLVFTEAPLNTVRIEFRHLVNPYVEIVAGTEEVKVGGVVFQRGAAPSDANRTYAIDYATGVVLFESAKTKVDVSYDFKVRYGLGFMGIGGLPEGHPQGKPVEFNNSDKLKTGMSGEYQGARQLIQYPAAISKGKAEVQVLPTKPIQYAEKTFTATGDGETDTFDVQNQNKVLKVVSAKVNGESTEATLVSAVDGTVKMGTVPEEGAIVEIVFQEQLGNDYLTYYLAEGPVLELVSVRHESNDHTITDFVVESKGLAIGKGDVWLLNPTQGIVQFKENPSVGVTPDTPGFLTFEYRINSGTTVQFVADFPKGVPGPMLVEETEVLPIAEGVSTYVLKHTVAKDNSGNNLAEVRRNGALLAEGTHYTIEGSQIRFNSSYAPTDVIAVKYSWYNETHDIYQVAMFTEQEGGEMFNISGIGPVTKDKNTGMRITWSVTF